MDLTTTIWIWAGGEGSGCHGPNCGRPKSQDPMLNIVRLQEYQNGLMLPDGKLMIGRPRHEQHFDLLQKTPYAREGQKFLKAGGVRLGREPNGFVSIGSDDRETMERALKILRNMPTDRVQFDYVPAGESALSRTVYVEGERDEVIEKVAHWWSRQHEGEEIAAEKAA
jgi:hypothetical protein